MFKLKKNESKPKPIKDKVTGMNSDYLSDTWIYHFRHIIYYVGYYRWGLFLLLKFLPVLFYRQITKKQVVQDEESTNNLAYKVSDISIIIPIYEPNSNIAENVISIAKNNPKEIIIVADQTCYEAIQKIIDEISENGIDKTKIKVVNEENPGKRVAMVTGMKLSSGSLICFVDDDVLFMDHELLDKVVLPFCKYDKMGGVGVKQVAKPKNGTSFNVAEVMADMRLATRYIEIRSTTVVDKGTSCISGRTACYRADIIRNETFYQAFLNEMFFGMLLQSGDDKFLTRYVINQGYKTYHQLNHDTRIATTFESGWKYIQQCLRWRRNTWRSDITFLFWNARYGKQIFLRRFYCWINFFCHYSCCMV
jgi:glycosyltransferase involved in cell wall biosynthesis